MLKAIKRHTKHVVLLLDNKLRDIAVDRRRSSHWDELRDAFLKRNGTCAACRNTKNLNVHHIVPFHLDPTKELEESNLITLCMSIDHHCHLHIGHGDSFRAYNPHVKSDAAAALRARAAGDFKKVAEIEDTAKASRRYNTPHVGG